MAYAAVNCSVPGPANAESSLLTVASGRRREWEPGQAWDSPLAEALGEALGPAATPVGTAAAWLLGRPTRPARGERQVLVGEVAPGPLRLVDLRPGELPAGFERVMVLAPAPGPPSGGEWQELGFLLAWGRDVPPGLISSATTRTPGLIALADIAPTLMEFAHRSPTGPLEGRTCTWGAPGEWDDFASLVRWSRWNRAAMLPLLLGWGALTALALILTGRALRPEGGASQLVACRLMAAAASAPGAWLWLAAAQHERPLGLVPAALLLGVLALPRDPLPWAYAASVAAILWDLVLGTRLLALNVMSDFANVGGRFYGIGNEYLGLLAGGVLSLPVMLAVRQGAERGLDRSGRIAALVLWGPALVCVGSPRQGADFGGAVSLALAYVPAWWWLSGRRLVLRQALAALAAALLVAVALLGVDMLQPPHERSHLGNLVARVAGEGWGPVWDVAQRKLLLNLDMARSPWTLLGVGSAAAILLLGRRRLGERILPPSPLERSALRSLLVAGLITALLNDTGIIAGLLCVGAGVLLCADGALRASIRKDTA